MEQLRVLVVDDEAGMRAAVARALEGFTIAIPEVESEVRFHIEQAASGEEALEKIEASAPDLLLLDHKLPGISGLDVLAALSERSLDLLTVMMTAYASLETAVVATKRGAYDFLAKPFTPEELKTTVRKTVKHLLLQRQARRLALEKRQIRFQFISILVHELKAPLAAIQGYLNIMQNRAIGNEIASYDSAIDRSLVRLEGMRKLIMDLLDLTRLESGQKQRDLVSLDICEIARKAIETVTPDANARRIGVEMHAEGPISMTADPGEVEIVLNNLVTNAVKYNREAGHVDVRINADDDVVTIRVADTGIGMTPEESAKLFGEFVRIKNDKTRNILGSGLGLSIVKKIAQVYGGDVSVASEPDVGSTFTVVLGRSGVTKEAGAHA
jgi:two-component system, sensor histidine kinase and response regulator